MKRRALASSIAGAVLLGLSQLSVVPTSPAAAAPAGTEHRPDLQTLVPTDSFSVVTTPTGKEFRYTHLVYNDGPGPLEVQPSYDQASGGYRGMQQLYTHDAAGAWSMTRQVRVPDTFVYHAEHGHFHFPLAAFGLYRVAAGGGVGTPIAISPKNGFCIDDSYIQNPSLEHSGVFIGGRSSCTDPSGLRGISVGGADEYDYRDPGQAIPFDGVPDGTYWFRAITDPNNDFVETNEANNETDVKVTVAGARVTAGTVTHPATTPPSANFYAPAEGAVVKGTIALTATSSTAGVAKVEFLVDGHVVGTDTTSPYAVGWASTRVVDGPHWFTARVTDSLGRVNTGAVHQAVVNNVSPPPPPPGTALSLEGHVSSDGAGTRSATLSRLHGGDLLVATVSADGPGGTGQQRATVTGSGLTWQLVLRSNDQPGTSEVWKAILPSTATTATVTSALLAGGADQALGLYAFRGSAGVGGAIAASAATGTPATSLRTSTRGSHVVSVGNDWSRAAARTAGSGQVVDHQWVDTTAGDTFWTQRTTSQVPAAGTVVRSTTTPATGTWNLVSFEVLAAAYTPPPPDTTPPTVSVTDPEAGARVSRVVALGANASDNVRVASVAFTVDGRVVGRDTAPPFMVSWNSATVAAGTHRIAAVATDAAGNSRTSSAIAVTVVAAPPLVPVAVERSVTVRGTGTLNAPPLTTSRTNDVLVALVSLDGSGARTQSARVAGGGLTWTLVKRSNTQGGDSEIWTATAPRLLSGAVITATPVQPGYHGMLTVVAFANAKGTGVAGATGAPSGAPSIYLPGVAQGARVFAVGNDWDGAVARTPRTGQLIASSWLDPAGNTFWVQMMQAPEPRMGLVTVADTAPTNHQWNYAAVEIQPR